MIRDLLAGFAADFVFGYQGVKTFKALLKNLKHNSHSRFHLADELLDAGNRGGWIAVFTSYRNLFTHAASLQNALGVHHAYQDTRVLYTKAVPQLYYPLPRDPEALVREHSTGLMGTLPSLQSEPAEPNRFHEHDALEYLYTTFDRFIHLAIKLALSAPVEPQMPTITDDDIIEFKQM